MIAAEKARLAERRAAAAKEAEETAAAAAAAASANEAKAAPEKKKKVWKGAHHHLRVMYRQVSQRREQPCEKSVGLPRAAVDKVRRRAER